MVKLRVSLIVRAEDETDFTGLVAAVKQRIETQPILRWEKIKALVVTSVERDN